MKNIKNFESFSNFELRKKFAEKVLNEKLDHLPIKESMELFNSDEKIEKTREDYVYCIEDYETIDNLLEEYGSLENALKNNAIEIGDSYDHFDEFTESICPAPTYIELIRSMGYPIIKKK